MRVALAAGCITASRRGLCSSLVVREGPFNSFRLLNAPLDVGFSQLHPRKILIATDSAGSKSMTLSHTEMKDRIQLTNLEKRIFERLLGTLSHFNLQTHLRVAGGWVRDKILGKECYDIDIAIDNMLGREFCEKVTEYLSLIDEKTRGVGIVPRNPVQSKHLETATMQICDIWIDFVNLRSEDYSEDSRIPIMKFGTTEEDAYRRDLTINSLFYNINTGDVEDFTGRGIEDLRSGRIVTPLPPKETFLDDPLRVLRAIRFGARFEFTLDEELKDAARSDEVKNALKNKISRERIGHEVDLMMSGDRPSLAIASVLALDLFEVVFTVPSNMDCPASQFCGRYCTDYLDAAWKLISSVGHSTFSDEQRTICLYAALFLPLRNATFAEKLKKIAVVDYVFRSSLKLKSSYIDNVINIHKMTEKFLQLIPSLLLLSRNENELRVATGLVVRQIKEFWRVSLLLSVLLHSPQEEAAAAAQLFARLENSITTLGVEKAWELKPLINGRDILEVLQLKAGGPVVREWQHKVLEWQLAHPLATPEECLSWMREAVSKRLKLH